MTCDNLKTFRDRGRTGPAAAQKTATLDVIPLQNCFFEYLNICLLEYINLYNHLDLLFIAHFSSLLLKMSELNLPCSPGGTLLEDLHMDSLSSDSDDGQDDVKKRKLPITDKGQLIPKPNSKSSI